MNRQSSLIALVSLLSIFGLASAGEVKTRTFDTPDARGAWRTWEKDLSSVTVDKDHGPSLAIPVAFPQVKQIWCGSRERPAPLARVFSDPERPAISWERFQFDLYLPPESLPDGIRVQCRLLLQNKDGLWFEGIGRRRREDGRWVAARALQPGWNTVQLDLSHNSAELTPHGHRMRWSRFFLTQIAAIGFSLQGDRPYNATVAIDNITTWSASDDAFPPLKVYDFAAERDEVACYDRATLSFLVNRPLFNPFEENEIKADAIFKTPDGKSEIRVPAFYYQPYRREKGNDTGPVEDRYTPVGRGLFKVRFTPRQAGVYTYRLELTYRSPIRRKEEAFVSGVGELKVTPRADRGFVRVSERDKRYFEFEDGSFFYPLGHSFRSPVDKRHVKRILRPYYPRVPVPKDRGLRIYEEQLPKMKKAGINCFEVWMASWWLGLEWTGRWKNYHGLGVYNMENAWKLDALVDLAEEHEQYIHLTIDNHGKASQSLALRSARGRQKDRGQHDHEWENSPYNRDNRLDGGFLHYSKQLFSDEQARRHYRNKMRYIAARWGWSTHIYGIEMWSELDLIGHIQGRHRSVYGSPHVHKWHEEMTSYLRSQDHGNHVITTHYSGDFRFIDRNLVAKPCIDYIACDAYHSPRQHLVDMLTETERVCLPFHKPFMVTEFGGDWSASNIEGLTGDLYTGLWWGWMSGTAGAPMYWWFEYLELAKLYPAYTAIARFTAGEDKRRPPGQPTWRSGWPSGLTSDDERHQPLQVLVAGDSQLFYAWVFDRNTMHHLPRSKEQHPWYDGIRLKLFQLQSGTYQIESWDSWTGKKIDSYVAKTARDRSLTVVLPKFRVHMAVKVRPLPADRKGKK